ncbi:MAG: hypothetical protein ACLU9P_13530 [[Ruminococcus] torques]
MQLSATELGKEYGLSGEEMNRVLVKLGYLMGEPGDYDVTIKGSPYAVTKKFSSWNRWLWILQSVLEYQNF